MERLTLTQWVEKFDLNEDCGFCDKVDFGDKYCKDCPIYIKLHWEYFTITQKEDEFMKINNINT